MSVIRQVFSRRMFVNLMLGVSSGLPLLLTSRTLQGWMTTEGVSLKVIGLFGIVGMPYTLKFIWSPLFDRFTLPFLGRRRGWLLITQILLAIAILFLSLQKPQENLWLVAFAALLVSFFSASQDIVVDAYRRESLREEELGLGSSFYVYGYRIAMWISGALAFILADQVSWPTVFKIMAVVMSIGMLTTFFAEEPAQQEAPPRNFKEAMWGPLAEFFRRPEAWIVLAFILLYKLGDTLAGAMATPFYIKLGFTNTDIGAIAKTFGFFSALAGGLVGGLFILKYRVNKALWVFGVLQALSTFGFAALSQIGAERWALACVIAFEDFSGGLGTAAFTAFMAAQTNRRFTATQYALLTSLMAFSRTFITMPTGFMAESWGWFNYFFFCAVIAVPGMLLLLKLAPWKDQNVHRA